MSAPRQQETLWVGDRLCVGLGVVLLSSLPFSNALVEISASLLLLVFIGVIAIRRPPLPRTFVRLLLLWLVACLVSVVTSAEPALSLGAFLKKTAEYALIGLVVSYLGQDQRIASRLFSVLIWTGLVVGVDAAMQSVIGRDLRLRPLQSLRLTGPFNSPNNLASYLLMVIPLQLWWIRRIKVRRQLVLWAAGLVVETWVLTRTDARGPWVALLIAITLCLFLTRHLKLLWFLGLLGGVGLWYWDGFQVIATLLPLDPGRAEGWSVAWRMFLDHPITGLGLGRYMAHYMEYLPSLQGDWPRPQYAHNCYLQLLAESGIIGFAAFSLLIGWVMLKMITRICAAPPDPSNSMPALWTALAAFLINISFDTGLYSLPLVTLFWFLLGLAAGQLHAKPGTSS